MSYFAEIENGIVKRVIVADQSFINSGIVGDPKNWVETQKYGKNKIRKNFAVIGMTYDKTRDAFVPPKPFESFILDEATCRWNAPKQMPQDGKNYIWDDKITDWKELSDNLETI